MVSPTVREGLAVASDDVAQAMHVFHILVYFRAVVVLLLLCLSVFVELEKGAMKECFVGVGRWSVHAMSVVKAGASCC